MIMDHEEYRPFPWLFCLIYMIVVLSLMAWGFRTVNKQHAKTLQEKRVAMELARI